VGTIAKEPDPWPRHCRQGGYADFSVSQSKLEQVKLYIGNQQKHKHKVGFQDELRVSLKRHEIEWDEKYVRDSPAKNLRHANPAKPEAP